MSERFPPLRFWVAHYLFILLLVALVSFIVVYSYDYLADDSAPTTKEFTLPDKSDRLKLSPGPGTCE